MKINNDYKLWHTYFCRMEKQTQPVEQWLANLKIKALNEMQLASIAANRQHGLLLTSQGYD